MIYDRDKSAVKYDSKSGAKPRKLRIHENSDTHEEGCGDEDNPKSSLPLVIVYDSV